MARPDKVEAVEEIAERFRDASASVVTEYRGLSMTQLTTLRRTLGADVTYRIAKNTLVRRAAADAGVDGLDELLTGPTAIAFVTGEPVEAAKALRNFAKDNRGLVIKGGFMDGRPLTVDEVNRIADLESREVLLAKLAGAMKGNLAKAAGLFAAPARRSPAWPRPWPTSARPRPAASPPRPRTTRHPQPKADPTPLHPEHTPERHAPWPSCPPTSCSTRSRT